MDPKMLREWATLAVSVLNAIIFIGLLIAVTQIKDMELYRTLFTAMVMSGIGNFGTVVGYYLGSSAGSATKTEILHPSAAETLRAPPPRQP